MAFVCVCPEKSLELGEDEKLHRAHKEHFITKTLESAVFGQAGTKVLKCLPGGGVAVERTGHSARIAVEGPFIAAITGSLMNYGYLVKKYLHDELHLPATVTLEAIKERMPITEAALLCRLYGQLGTGMLSKLRGHFSLVLYDSTTVRVLAARDPSGAVPLWQGQLEDNTLFVTSGSFHPSGEHDLVEIRPGHYKYGWRAAPRKYTNPETEVKSHAQAASSAAEMALAGISCHPTSSHNASWLHSVRHPARRSLDGSYRQGTRRCSLENPHTGTRRSLDSNVLHLGADHHKSRADEHGWWRAKESEETSKDTPSPTEDANNTSEHPKKRRHRKRHRKAKAKQTPTEAKETAADSSNEHSSDSGSEHRSVEEFINKLPTLFREDSASARMLMNLLGSSPCALVVTDACQADNPIVFVNEQFEQNTGYSTQEVVGKNCRFLQASPGNPRVPSAASGTVRSALDNGTSVSVKMMNYKKDGSPVWNELSIVPLRNAEGKITHHVGMQTFTPVQDVEPSPAASVGFGIGSRLKSSMVRSRSCNDMNALDRPTHFIENFAF